MIHWYFATKECDICEFSGKNWIGEKWSIFLTGFVHPITNNLQSWYPRRDNPYLVKYILKGCRFPHPLARPKMNPRLRFFSLNKFRIFNWQLSGRFRMLLFPMPGYLQFFVFWARYNYIGINVENHLLFVKSPCSARHVSSFYLWSLNM